MTETSDEDARQRSVGTHTQTSTGGHGPDYCAECSEAIADWVKWPCSYTRATERGALVLRPIIRDQAKAFIGEHHRHAKRAVPGWKFGTGIFVDGQLVGVGIAGRPSAREWDAHGQGEWIEVTRVGTTGVQNGCSRLYGALIRAAKALGYCTAWTFTLDRESGVSLRASGWIIDAERPPRSGWDCESRPREEIEWPAEAKVLWKQTLHPCEMHHDYQTLTDRERIAKAKALAVASSGGSGADQ